MVFAWLYLAEPGAVTNVRPGSFEDAFYFSVQTLATIGYGGMAPASRYGHLIVAGGSDCRHPDGFALITGLTFTPLHPGDGAGAVLDKVVHLTARRCPARHVPDGQLAPHRIVEARLSAVLLVTERTREGR